MKTYPYIISSNTSQIDPVGDGTELENGVASLEEATAEKTNLYGNYTSAQVYNITQELTNVLAKFGMTPDESSTQLQTVFEQINNDKNIIINGDMLVSQSENAVLGYFKNGNFTYPADRWACWSTVNIGSPPTGIITRNNQQWQFAKRGYNLEFYNYMTSDITLQHHVRYRMEANDSRNLCNFNIINDPFSISILVQHNWGTSKNLTLYLRTPSSKNNFTTTSVIYTQTIAIPTGTPTRIKFEGITTNSPYIINGLELEFIFDAGISTYGDTLQISEIQAENNNSSTSFNYKNYSTELLACQRYFNVITKAYGNTSWVASPAVNNNRIGLFSPFPTEMISSPNITYSTNLTAWPVQLYEFNPGVTNILVNSIITNLSNIKGMALDAQININSGNCRPLIQAQGFIYANSEL